MAEEKKNINPVPQKPRRPVIRTMQSDTEELFKNNRPTVSQMINPETRRLGYTTPSGFPKLLLFGGGVVVLLGLGFLGWKFFIPEEPSVTFPTKSPVPSPFFTPETSRTITIKDGDRKQFLLLMQDALNEQERYGTIKRLLIKIQEGANERYATLNDFLSFYRLSPPDNFTSQITGPLMTFIYYSPDGNRLGLAAKTKDPDRTLAGLLSWESSAIIDLQPLFFGEKPGQILSPTFEDRVYRNIDWRFLKLSQTKDFGIGYTIFPANNVVVLTFSKDGVETAINRLFEAR